MPIHDWTRVRAGTFHDFHCSWITHLKETLNAGLLPPNYYALAEQSAEDVVPDVLALESADPIPDEGQFGSSSAGGSLIAVAEHPPRVSMTVEAEEALCAARARTLTIRHATGDEIVALLEIVSPGNKQSPFKWRTFIDKAVAALQHGYHLLLIDLFPPGPHDPDGLHAAVWYEIDGTRFTPPSGKPLTLTAYVAAATPRAYVEPIAVGSVLPEMPLFVTPGWYVNVPLEQTYQTAWRGIPERWRRVIEGR